MNITKGVCFVAMQQIMKYWVNDNVVNKIYTVKDECT